MVNQLSSHLSTKNLVPHFKIKQQKFNSTYDNNTKDGIKLRNLIIWCLIVTNNQVQVAAGFHASLTKITIPMTKMHPDMGNKLNDNEIVSKACQKRLLIPSSDCNQLQKQMHWKPEIDHKKENAIQANTVYRIPKKGGISIIYFSTVTTDRRISSNW